ncbi:hypothetical protein AVEN_118605-1 [Araneus ventricosus]|uniref:Uncharacterized protein n=1 Tax=Araneus ventricosus TaxID=182803 RepID=A0A4Y2AYP3_ARAVE|nr:hypothetical protein AVEN_118605-1 [Araneus ventricosus]
MSQHLVNCAITKVFICRQGLQGKFYSVQHKTDKNSRGRPLEAWNVAKEMKVNKTDFLDFLFACPAAVQRRLGCKRVAKNINALESNMKHDSTSCKVRYRQILFRKISEGERVRFICGIIKHGICIVPEIWSTDMNIAKDEKRNSQSKTITHMHLYILICHLSRLRIR